MWEHGMNQEALTVIYSSNRYGQALAEVRHFKGMVVAVTSDLARRLGLIERPDRQKELWK
jgi:hypothetical protein